jgi:asparagine N-glycosylation enzyme membrane subunit Stt3
METKITALISLVIIVILLLIIIRFKIKSDKKRKSLAIPYNETIKPKVKKSFLASFPSGVSALLSLIVFTIVLFVVGELVQSFDGGGITAYALFGLLSATACFFIVKQNPKSIWYVPLIINAFLIFSAIVEENFWRPPPDNLPGIPMWIPICGGWVLTIVVSIIGARIGRRKAISDNP